MKTHASANAVADIGNLRCASAGAAPRGLAPDAGISGQVVMVQKLSAVTVTSSDASVSDPEPRKQSTQFVNLCSLHHLAALAAAAFLVLHLPLPLSSADSSSQHVHSPAAHSQRQCQRPLSWVTRSLQKPSSRRDPQLAETPHLEGTRAFRDSLSRVGPAA